MDAVSTLAVLKAVIGLLPMLSLFIPELKKNKPLLLFLPTLIPLLDEVDDLVEAGGLTRKNMEEAVQRAFGALVTLYPHIGRIDEADLLELAGMNFEKIQKMVTDLGSAGRRAVPPPPTPEAQLRGGQVGAC